MSDEINLPDCPENNPLSVGNVKTQLVCDLHVNGDKVYLPQTDSVDFKSEEYEKCFLGALPDDIAPEVSSVLKAKRSHFTILRLLIIFLFLSAVSLAFYHFYPRMHFADYSDDPSEEGLTISDKYEGVCFKAKKEKGNKQWKSVIDTLDDCPEKLSNNEKETLDNLLLFRIYFDAINNCVDVPIDKKEKAKIIVDRVRKHSPDRLGWYLDWLRLNYPEECNYLSDGRYEPNEERADGIKELLIDVNPDRWEKAPDYKCNFRLLDLYYARLNFIYWCYSKPSKHLNKDDLGVFERERAYQICKKHTDDPDHIDSAFLQLRIEIIQAIIRAGTGVIEGWYYFDGKERYLSSHLQKELDRLNEYKKKLEKQK